MTMISYSGTVPSRSDSQTEFDTNVENFLNYIDTLAVQINTAQAEILALYSVTSYSGAATYNLPDTVYGSDGLTYRCAGTSVSGDDPVGSVTGDWVKLTKTSEEIVEELKDITPYVFDPQKMLWNVGLETKCGIGIGATDGSYYYQALVPFSSTAFTTLANVAAINQVVDNNYVTVANVTAPGVLTNLILPGVTATSDVVTAKITIDGTVFTIPFTAENATDRFFTGITEQHQNNSQYARGPWHGIWEDSDLVDGIAYRRDNSRFGAIISDPIAQISSGLCVRFDTNLKVEMKSSNFSATNNRDECAAVYILDLY